MELVREIGNCALVLSDSLWCDVNSCPAKLLLVHYITQTLSCHCQGDEYLTRSWCQTIVVIKDAHWPLHLQSHSGSEQSEPLNFLVL